MPQTKLQVAICGGGITGLAFANLLLKQKDIDFQIFEASNQFQEIGAGLGMWGRALDALVEDDLIEACKKIATVTFPHPELVFEMRKSDTITPGFTFGKWILKRGNLMFHRAQLLDVLAERIPSERVHFGKRFMSYNQDPSSGRMRLNFKDNTFVECDLVVGCDGIRSTIRAHMYRSAAKEQKRPELLQHINPVWTGTVAYRSLIPSKHIRALAPDHSIFRAPQMYGGKNKHLVVLPIRRGEYINMVSVVSDYSKEDTQYPEDKWNKEVSQEELLEAYKDFEPEAQILLKLMYNPTKWAIYSVGKPLPFYSKGKAVLIGDAAHAMSPHLGIGAGMGLEDARVLATFLSSPHITASNIHFGLSAYDKARVRQTGQVMLRARAQGMAYDFCEVGSGEDLKAVERFVHENSKWISDWNVEDDIKEGLRWIEEVTAEYD